MAARRIRGVRLTREERLEVRRLIGNGSSFEQAALAQLVCSQYSSANSAGLTATMVFPVS